MYLPIGLYSKLPCGRDEAVLCSHILHQIVISLKRFKGGGQLYELLMATVCDDRACSYEVLINPWGMPAHE